MAEMRKTDQFLALRSKKNGLDTIGETAPGINRKTAPGIRGVHIMKTICPLIEFAPAPSLVGG